MANRVKTWDVEDAKSLRRAIGAQDGYGNEGYYNQFVDAGIGAYSNGSNSSLYNPHCFVNCAR